MSNLRIAYMLVVAILCVARFVSAETSPSIEDVTLGNTKNVHLCRNLFLAGQPTQGDIPIIKEKGIKRVVTLREEGEVEWNERAAFEDAGLEFVQVPFRSPDSLTDDVFLRVRKLLQKSNKGSILLHCGSANRVGAVWLTYRVLDENVPLARAVEEAKKVGLRSEEYKSKALDYIERKTNPLSQKSVRPGINDRFLQADLDIAEWLGRFEIESREAYAARNHVIEACDIQSGSQVADIGAGTGFFARLFADAVGSDGLVFAVDIAPRFLEHINERAKKEGVQNIKTVLGSQRSVNLPPDSVDLVFSCDTYHHFEYPHASLNSIHRALRKDGTLIVIDFERIPGKSREFILGHVRAGKEVVRDEIESAGFEFQEEAKIDGFQENYFLRFRKK